MTLSGHMDKFSCVNYPSDADCEHIVCPRHSTVCHYPKDDQRTGMACICLAHSNHLSFCHISQTVKSGFSSLPNRPHTHKDGTPQSFPSINIRNRRLCANKY